MNKKYNNVNVNNSNATGKSNNVFSNKSPLSNKKEE